MAKISNFNFGGSIAFRFVNIEAELESALDFFVEKVFFHKNSPYSVLETNIIQWG